MKCRHKSDPKTCWVCHHLRAQAIYRLLRELERVCREWQNFDEDTAPKDADPDDELHWAIDDILFKLDAAREERAE